MHVRIVPTVVSLCVKLLQGKSWIGRSQGLRILFDIINFADSGLVIKFTGYISTYCSLYIYFVYQALFILKKELNDYNLIYYYCYIYQIYYYYCYYYYYLGHAIFQAVQLIPGRIWKGQETVFDILMLIFTKYSDRGYISSADDDDLNKETAVLSMTVKEKLIPSKLNGLFLCNQFTETKRRNELSTDNENSADGSVPMTEDSVSVCCIDETNNTTISKESEYVDMNLKQSNTTSHSSHSSHSFHLLLENSCPSIDDPLSSVDTSIYEVVDWRYSLLGCMQLLLHEARRGDRQYKLAVARAVAAFPLEKFLTLKSKVVDDFPSIFGPPYLFGRIFSELLHLIGFKLVLLSSKDTENSKEQVNKNEDEGQTNQTVKTATVKTATATTANVIKPTNKITNARPSNLFGSRYGVSFNSTVPKKRSFYKDKTPELIASSTALKYEFNDPNFPASKERPLFSADNQFYFRYLPEITQDPGYRLKLLECFSRLIEKGVELHENFYLSDMNRSIDFFELRESITIWARELYDLFDAWSIKKKSLELISIIISSFKQKQQQDDDSNDNSDQFKQIVLDTAMYLISSGVQDLKSFHIRAKSFELLSNMIQADSLKALLSENSSKIESIFLNFSSEKNSDVIEKASKALKFWKLFNLN